MVPNLEAMVKAYLKENYAKPAGVSLGIPHRLDRPVSGVVCFARNTKAAKRVHAPFAEHRVRKVYWALVEGEVNPDADTWEDWVRKLPEESRVERAKEGEPGAKPAMLGYRVLKRFEGVTLLELTPLTGRMHQLRVQAAWRGHPVLVVQTIDDVFALVKSWRIDYLKRKNKSAAYVRLKSEGKKDGHI